MNINETPLIMRSRVPLWFSQLLAGIITFYVLSTFSSLGMPYIIVISTILGYSLGVIPFLILVAICAFFHRGLCPHCKMKGLHCAKKMIDSEELDDEGRPHSYFFAYCSHCSHQFEQHGEDLRHITPDHPRYIDLNKK